MKYAKSSAQKLNANEMKRKAIITGRGRGDSNKRNRATMNIIIITTTTRNTSKFACAC